MAEDQIPQSILANHPELVRVGEALQQHASGKAVTAHCLICDKPLRVATIRQTGAIIVECDTGCTFFRALRRVT